MADRFDSFSVSREDPLFAGLEGQYHDLVDQCDSLRRSNLQLREEILRLEKENADLKRQTLLKTSKVLPLMVAQIASLSDIFVQNWKFWPISANYEKMCLNIAEIAFFAF